MGFPQGLAGAPGVAAPRGGPEEAQGLWWSGLEGHGCHCKGGPMQPWKDCQEVAMTDRAVTVGEAGSKPVLPPKCSLRASTHGQQPTRDSLTE